MKNRLMLLLVSVALLSATFSCSDNGSYVKKKVELKTLYDSAAYAIGTNLGVQFKNDSLMMDIDIVAAGIYDGLNLDSGMISQAQMQEIFTRLTQEVQIKQQQRMNAQSDINIEKGKKFLEENKNKAGVKVTESGLQYEVLTEGNGPKPNDSSTVRVHYKGTLLDGKVFDSSYDRNQPAEFPLNGVIKGWSEGLQLMSVGSKYRLYIPQDLAYGPQGAGDAIPPGSTIIFEVELLEILNK